MYTEKRPAKITFSRPLSILFSLSRLLPLNSQLLDLVAAVLLRFYEEGYPECFSAGIEVANGVFHRGFAAFVDDCETFWSICNKEVLHDLGSLHFAAITCLAKDIKLQIVGEPG